MISNQHNTAADQNWKHSDVNEQNSSLSLHTDIFFHRERLTLLAARTAIARWAVTSVRRYAGASIQARCHTHRCLWWKVSAPEFTGLAQGTQTRAFAVRLGRETYHFPCEFDGESANPTWTPHKRLYVLSLSLCIVVILFPNFLYFTYIHLSHIFAQAPIKYYMWTGKLINMVSSVWNNERANYYTMLTSVALITRWTRADVVKADATVEAPFGTFLHARCHSRPRSVSLARQHFRSIGNFAWKTNLRIVILSIITWCATSISNFSYEEY